MNKKKKVTIGIVCCSIIMLAVVGILIYIHLLPYIRLKKTVDNLLNKQYEYKIDGKVEGMDLPLLGNSFQGKINGEKGKNVVYGDISYKDSTYLSTITLPYHVLSNIAICPVLGSLFQNLHR